MADLVDIQRRLQKLLALSASPNEAEALLAMEKASALMEKYNIRTIDVHESTNTADIDMDVVFGYTNKHRTWESKLGHIIAECFDGRIVIQRREENWNLAFIASKSELPIIIDLFIRLRRIISKMSKEYAGNTEGHTGALQRSYCFGMIHTIHSRLQGLYAEIPSTRALVVVKTDAIANKIAEKFGKLSKLSISAHSNKEAYMRGRVDGKKVALHKSVHGKPSTEKKLQ